MACCKECQQIGKKMAKERRSSKFMDGIKRTGAIAAGIGTGAVVVPQVVGMIDKEGKMNPNLVNGVGIAGAIWFARKQKGLVQDALYGLAGGLGWNLLSQFVPMNGLGYVDDFSTDFNKVAGSRDNDFSRSRPNPGTV